MATLDGNATLITGAGSGLGLALTRCFVEQGASVGALEKSPEKAQGLRDEFGDHMVIIEGDVTSADDNTMAVARTVERFGKLDTLIANAGLWDFGTPLTDIPIDKLSAAYDQLFAVNVKGYLLGAAAALPALEESNGSIILTLSNAAFMAGGGGVLYTAAKYAGRGIVSQLAYELAPNVRVNAVAPGGMATDLRGVDALGNAERSFGDMIEAGGGEELIAERMGRRFFPQATDYVMGYVLLASEGSRTTTGAVFEMHGMLPNSQGNRKA